MNEPMQSSGEALLVPERVIVAPAVGVFRPLTAATDDELVAEGQPSG